MNKLYYLNNNILNFIIIHQLCCIKHFNAYSSNNIVYYVQLETDTFKISFNTSITNYTFHLMINLNLHKRILKFIYLNLIYK